jgi:hypothetical protein
MPSRATDIIIIIITMAIVDYHQVSHLTGQLYVGCNLKNTSAGAAWHIGLVETDEHES